MLYKNNSPGLVVRNPVLCTLVESKTGSSCAKRLRMCVHAKP